ncbi:MAG TPA: hypothetical protein PLS95_06855 [Thermoanaerobaculales bacterium]|nr:hypothetical protein [Thermoanaerobaculales bacterium]HQN95947.1 hypothetical protein [Thermoanaerobaculales bacterium]HQP43311.1 hypothetical protein [Thermoanaerobaculales bacterium]
MADVTTLKEAVAQSGPFAVWALMNEDEQRAAATALWQNSDRETRIALEQTLAKEMKFRPQSIHRLPLDRVVGRLVRLAEDIPENVLFQYLFHLHMADRRPLLAEFLDAAGIPHNDGVLDLPEEFDGPDAARVGQSAKDLVAAHGHAALVYLATLKVADKEFWKGLDQLLEAHAADGTPRSV